MKFELERRTVIEVLEGILTAEVALAGFRIQWIFAVVELLSLLIVGKHFFGRSYIDEFLFGYFLCITLIRVRMPFLCHLSVCFHNFTFGCLA